MLYHSIHKYFNYANVQPEFHPVFCYMSLMMMNFHTYVKFCGFPSSV